jgi:hypothetical protein
VHDDSPQIELVPDQLVRRPGADDPPALSA